MSSIKNRDRQKFTFANINLLGKCNVDCFFCLGKDISDLINQHNQLTIPFHEWKDFDKFLGICANNNIKKIYLTGQNTDPLLYFRLQELIDYIQDTKIFDCGIRTNGYLALDKMNEINSCREEIGYSVHSIDPTINKMILGRNSIPDWDKIFKNTTSPMRVAIVVNRCNETDIYSTLRYLARYDNIRYIQMRKPSTDTRFDLLSADMSAYERVYTAIKQVFPLKYTFAKDAEVYDVFGKEVVFWRTVQTDVNSINYFTDGIISEEYFIVEGYLKQHNI